MKSTLGRFSSLFSPQPFAALLAIGLLMGAGVASAQSADPRSFAVLSGHASFDGVNASNHDSSDQAGGADHAGTAASGDGSDLSSYRDLGHESGEPVGRDLRNNNPGVVPSIPEPASTSLMLVGAVLAAVFIRRRAR